MLLGRKFEITKTPRESLLAAYDCCLAHLTSSYTPPATSLNFECTCSVGGRFLSRLVYPKFRSLLRLRVEVWTSAENQRETNLKRLTASVDGALLTLV